ncbi:MAG: hypothetical protein DMF88_07810 [Acidobacteria bacterium]|nr:MAG: hypothetical protein DMF88_07810 [Acidobacteriota bacterium]
MRRRWLLLTTDFPPSTGGIQQLLWKLASGLAATDSVIVVAPAARGDREFDRQQSIVTVRVPLLRWRVFSIAALWIWALAATIRYRPTAIICGHAMMGPAAAVARIVGRIPVVAMVYGSEVRSPRILPLATLTMNTANRVVTISRFTASEIKSHGIAAESIAVIPPGAGGEQYDCVDAGSTNGHVLLSVSRLADRYKGHDMVLRALPLIRGRVPDVRYVIAGDGPLRPFLERMAVALGVADAVQFVGEIDAHELDAWYRRCDLFVLASREEASAGGAEGFGLVFIEAALRGKPSLGGRSGGIPDAVLDGVTGVLVDPQDPVAIARAAIDLLSNPARAASLGAAARARAENELSWRAYIAAFREVLDQTLH